jgi:hypothetical protein
MLWEQKKLVDLLEEKGKKMRLKKKKCDKKNVIKNVIKNARKKCEKKM